ncbi:hypothetical protein [Methylobacterium planeticum]|uniref:DUF1311 domain-containing protein n=1 Tax=Methylobacterium planeticum TaxID=2615211 RepID=A0A6N6MUL5_9HYPH|nr:hypothetical protein [Methylobacterium planeticum]KAB1074418.1 hypothetical protein F6X51_08635 [Methylobacterium planeticum]
MRIVLLIPALILLGVEPGVAASVPDLPGLERAWHGCVREAYGRQPSSQSRLAAERSALDECKDREDAYVAAILAARITEEAAPGQGARAMASRAMAWASSVAGSMIDPVSSWLRSFRR